MTYKRGDILLKKYQVEGLVGKGAFGEIYLVSHATLHNQVAIKLLSKGENNNDSMVMSHYRERFRLEAQLAASLNHPNIIRVYDFEEWGEQLALVMDYAPNGSLLEKLKQYSRQGAQMPVAEALRIATDIASGLAELHRLEIIHRDLKPSNILLDANGKALIADLGIAQAPGGMTTRSVIDTTLPAHPGTPAYMSPEQENSRGYLKPPSDIYSFGVILFEMLTGRNYKSLRAGTRVRSLRPDVPAKLDALLARMLSTDPKDRPWDGEAMLKELNNMRGVSSMPAWAWGLTGAAVLIVIVLGLFLSGRNSDPKVAGLNITPGTPTVLIVPENTSTLPPEITKTKTKTPTRTVTATPTLVTVEGEIVYKSVYMRTGPHTNHPAVSKPLSKGSKVIVLEKTDDGWFYVRASNGDEGWLYMDWLEIRADVSDIPLSNQNLTVPVDNPTEPQKTESPEDNSGSKNRPPSPDPTTDPGTNITPSPPVEDPPTDPGPEDPPTDPDPEEPPTDPGPDYPPPPEDPPTDPGPENPPTDPGPEDPPTDPGPDYPPPDSGGG